VRLLTPSIVDAEKVLAVADWSAARSGDAPRSGGTGARTIDRLDVADPESESAHGFAWRNRDRGGDAGSFVRRAGFAGRPDDEVVDGGRTVFGEVEFEIARDPSEPAALVVRTVTGFRQRLLVSVDGAPEREVEVYAPGAGLFLEQPVAVVSPGAGRARARIRVSDEAASSSPLILAHVFALAGAEE
jgi:hypothetical protein